MIIAGDPFGGRIAHEGMKPSLNPVEAIVFVEVKTKTRRTT
jgi:hypothetical protein